MKKTLLAVMALLCVCALGIWVGHVMTGEDSPAAEGTPTSPVLTLDSSPTTGYDWYWEIDQEDVVAVDETYTQYAVPQDTLPLVGGGGQDCMTLTGLTPGEAVVTFTYKRIWETTTPLYTLVYHVRVDEDLNVAILSSSFDW